MKSEINLPISDSASRSCFIAATVSELPYQDKSFSSEAFLINDGYLRELSTYILIISDSYFLINSQIV